VALRASEWVNVVAFCIFLALAWLLGLDRRRRVKIAAFGVAGLAASLIGALVFPGLVTPRTASRARDWIPLLQVWIFYSLAGQFVTRSDIRVEAQLERLDRMLVAPWLEWCARRPIGAWILNYLEASYFSYYALMPAALAVLYLAGKAREIDFFWTAVLLASHGSCGLLAFVQTRPPRALGEKWSVPMPSSQLRNFNLWILRHGSIQTNTCPSAHVAIAGASALVFLQVGPLWVGLVFLAAAISIALGAVGGRYHYAADAILGWIAAGLAYAVGRVICS